MSVTTQSQQCYIGLPVLGLTTCGQASGLCHLFAIQNSEWICALEETLHALQRFVSMTANKKSLTSKLNLRHPYTNVYAETPRMSVKPHVSPIHWPSRQLKYISGVFEAHQGLLSLYQSLVELSASQMSWKLLIKVLVVHVFASCDILPQQTGIYDLLQASVVSPAPTFINDSSAPTSNTSFDNVLKLRCDPVRYGRNLKVESCRKILGFISESDEQSVFADRGSVQPHDSNLPFRATSSKCLIISSLLYLLILPRHIKTCNLPC